jgi:hypothetical protein
MPREEEKRNKLLRRERKKRNLGYHAVTKQADMRRVTTVVSLNVDKKMLNVQP